eukprot:CAMPEP_0194696860 /NCGR_PEP_ID=MMETSP0295-20121207/22999_1 /TAXON_ID=39354 /ORGANISM="Heterosigma akashiwo, Strain CCMP2393" /LENGTH=69 /DNA_ID=CAMNT_0039589255 /DNA_START=248 /DNA_END=457 /DNA_ORIENTATION=-
MWDASFQGGEVQFNPEALAFLGVLEHPASPALFDLGQPGVCDGGGTVHLQQPGHRPTGFSLVNLIQGQQ